jgi:hypothetical protein
MVEYELFVTRLQQRHVSTELQKKKWFSPRILLFMILFFSSVSLSFIIFSFFAYFVDVLACPALE